MENLNVLTIGGSRNIGYLSSIRLLDLGATVTFMLRTPEVFDNDATIQKYTRAGKARLIQGDALIKEDVKRAWAVAAGEDSRPVDFLLFTVGATGTPHFELSNGFVISPLNLVTQSLHNALSTITSPHPKVIIVTSAGVTREGHKKLPFLLRLMYAYFLAGPHADKRGAEEALAYSAGWSWEKVDSPGEEILGSHWKEGLPAPGTLKAVIVRPALLTNGVCKEEERKGRGKEAYRVAEVAVESGCTVSRKDVSHFVVEKVMRRWEEWEGKRVGIAY